MESGMSSEEIDRYLHNGIGIDELVRAVENGTLNDQDEAEPVPDPAEFTKPDDYSDAGNADVFSSMNIHRLRWVKSLGWISWDGKQWKANEQQATVFALEFTEKMLKDALEDYRAGTNTDAKTGKIVVSEDARQYYQHARKSRSMNAIKSMMELSKAKLQIDANDLDSNYWELNTAQGIIDLRTGNIRPHDPTSFCTHIAPYVPGEGSREVFHEFVQQITGADPKLVRYLQIILGSMLYGKIFMEALFIVLGNGRNGKSTFINVCGHAIGDYCTSIDAQVLTTDRQNRGATLATLRGCRMAIGGELEEGQRLSAKTLKRVCSTDDLVIEAKYHQPETITPSHHIILFSNFLPRVGSTDNGTWRRIKVIPFNADMPTGQNERPDYADYLLRESGGVVLEWLIEGARLFYEAGYRVEEPEAVKAATEAYKDQEDWLKEFLDERCHRRQGDKVRPEDLYREYQDFARANGDYCRRRADFKQAMERAGYSRKIYSGDRYWVGVSIDLKARYGSGSSAAYGS